ncbi:DUF433 domain-containing protein [Streptosporangium sp. 'caverna']|uniref:DUF433 domain-containing protein n=1 Tax=Streptosporangium sp. 'caverna' TaxID=2202249 RepID=UPI001EF8A015|nr:DUF433 domain-containing protein [Streptosporangium sp. 'caverna']
MSEQEDLFPDLGDRQQTRVPYDEVAALLRDGVPAERICDHYPSVTATAALDAADFADHVNSYDPPGSGARLLDGNVSRPLHRAITAFSLGHEIVHLLDLDRWSGTRDEHLYPRRRKLSTNSSGRGFRYPSSNMDISGRSIR